MGTVLPCGDVSLLMLIITFYGVSRLEQVSGNGCRSSTRLCVRGVGGEGGDVRSVLVSSIIMLVEEERDGWVMASCD